MAKYIHLLRHGEESIPSGSLSPEGVAEVLRAYASLQIRVGLDIDPQRTLILTSSARRAKESARLISERIKLPDDRLIERPEISEGKPDPVLTEKAIKLAEDQIEEIDYDHVIIVSHLPEIEAIRDSFCELFGQMPIPFGPILTASLYTIDFVDASPNIDLVFSTDKKSEKKELVAP